MSSPIHIRAKATNLAAVLLTLVAILNVSGICADLLQARTAPAHACCPTPAKSAPKNCEKLGCVTAGPVIPATARTVDDPGWAPIPSRPLLVENAGPERLPVLGGYLHQSSRFLTFHQLLI